MYRHKSKDLAEASRCTTVPSNLRIKKEKKYTFLKEFVVFGWSIFFVWLQNPLCSHCLLHCTIHKKTTFWSSRFFIMSCVFLPPSTSSSCSSRMRPPSVQAASVFGPFYFFIFSLWNSCRTSTLPLLIDLHCTYLGSGRLLLWIFNYVGVVVEVSPPFFFYFCFFVSCHIFAVTAKI